MAHSVFLHTGSLIYNICIRIATLLHRQCQLHTYVKIPDTRLHLHWSSFLPGREKKFLLLHKLHSNCRTGSSSSCMLISTPEIQFQIHFRPVGYTMSRPVVEMSILTCLDVEPMNRLICPIRCKSFMAIGSSFPDGMSALTGPFPCTLSCWPFERSCHQTELPRPAHPQPSGRVEIVICPYQTHQHVLVA